jgi:hypothetical protein
VPRSAGKGGRKPFDPEVKHLTFERYLSSRAPLKKAGLPAVPLTKDVDRASKVSSWPMYMNDTIGDCTIAGEAHMIGALSMYATGKEALFSDQVIETVYSRNSGYVAGDESTDNGCLMSDVLADLKSNGITDTAGKVHKAAAYAKLGNAADENLLGQILDVFGSVYVGINVQPSIEDEFNNEQVWTYKPGEQFEGGHCIVLQRRYPAGSRHGILEYVTWGALQCADFGFQANCAEEAWAVVTEDWLRSNGTNIDGLDLQQLLSDMQYV